MTEKQIRGKECPWLSSNIRAKIKHRDYLLKKARKSNKEFDCNIGNGSKLLYIIHKPRDFSYRLKTSNK